MNTITGLLYQVRQYNALNYTRFNFYARKCHRKQRAIRKGTWDRNAIYLSEAEVVRLAETRAALRAMGRELSRDLRAMGYAAARNDCNKIVALEHKETGELIYV